MPPSKGNLQVCLFINKFLKQTHQLKIGRKVYYIPDYIRVAYCFIACYLTCDFYIFKNMQVSQDHETMAQVLFSRNLRLNVALTFWRRRSISELVAYLVR